MKSSPKKRIGLLILLILLAALGMAIKQVDRNWRQSELNRSLIAAVQKNDTTAAIVILAQGADPNAREMQPDTRALWLQLWDRLRGKSLPDREGPAVLLVALGPDDDDKLPPENVPLVKALLDAGANVNAAYVDGSTPLLLAAHAKYRETVRLLLDRGADVHARDLTYGGETVLAKATSGEDPALVRLLLDRGAGVNDLPSARATALHHAVFGRDTTVLRLLLARGANVNARDCNGCTPLMAAIRYNNVAGVKLLLAGGAQVDIPDYSHSTPLSFAQANKLPQIVKVLQQAGAKE